MIPHRQRLQVLGISIILQLIDTILSIFISVGLRGRRDRMVVGLQLPV